MDDRTIEDSLSKLKDEIPVNEDLKRSLRPSFMARKTKISRKWRFRFAAYTLTAMAACLVLLIYLMAPANLGEKVYAATLKIANQVSFLNIGQGSSLGISEHNGTLYMPIAGQGLFAYNQSGFQQIYDREVSFVRVSPDGKKLAFSENGSIKVYDLSTKTVRDILNGDGLFLYYEEPSWSPENDRLIYVKRVIEPGDSHGFTVKESGIYEMPVNGTKPGRKVADGSYPSYVQGTEAIVYEKDQQVMLKDLAGGTEKVIDAGRFPSVSPDGQYVAYIKVSQQSRQLGENASLVESLDNLWIADVGLETSRQVTTNYAHHFIDEQEWVKGLKPDSVPQVLGFSGTYSYYDPVWSSDGESIYVLKNNNVQGLMSLMRVDFSENKLAMEETVRRFIQALVVRDDDYARSLMKDTPELLTMSNPRQVGYNIVGSGKEDGQDYVNAEINWAYTANPYYRIVKSRFYLSPGTNGYLIDRIEEQGSIEVISPDNGHVTIVRDGTTEILFIAEDIPAANLPQGDHRVASLAYHEPTGTLVFTIQAMEDDQLGQHAYVQLLTYDVNTKQFKQIDTITSVGDRTGVGITNLILDHDGHYAALDLFEENDFQSHTFVYNLSSRQKTDLSALLQNTAIRSIGTHYWDNENLVFTVTSLNQAVGFIYQPDEETIAGFSD